jgi:CubicO group peptidase (beta-lactamase class C family)
MRIREIAFALALCLVHLSARAELPPDLEPRARAIVDEERALAGTPAMSVAIFADGKVVALFASGEADVEAHVPATTETLFQAASVTKILTAALVMREVERGRLSLDAPVNDSLPPERQVRDASDAPVPVTLRQLLSHSSGIPPSIAGIQEDPNEPPRALDDFLAHGLRTSRPPGEKLMYANDAFALAGWLAARAEAESFDALARSALFEPLEMSHSTFAPPKDAGPALAAAYGGTGPFMGKSRVPHQTISAAAPAGALITTASDLARLGLALLHGGELDGARVLAPESVAEMMRMQARAHPRLPEGFGLGFGVREVPGRKVVWWDGGLAGVAARLALLPEHGVGVAILSNLANNAPVSTAATRILELLVPTQRAVTPPSSAADDAAQVGTYTLHDVLDPKLRFIEWFANVRVWRESDGLRLALPLAAGPLRLEPAGDGNYTIDGRSMSPGSFVRFDGDRLYLGFLQADRISKWRSARAVFAYAGLVVLALVGGVVWLAVRWLRRRRRRARAL